MKIARRRKIAVIASVAAVIGGGVLRECESTLVVGAAAKGDDGRLELLLRSGADPNTKDFDAGYAVIQGACLGHTTAIHLLLASGANPNAHVSGGESALTYAVRNGHS